MLSKLYWPNLEDLVLNFQLCLKHSQAKCKPKPTSNDSYLLIMDFTSKFPVAHRLTSMTAIHVASHFSQVFSEYVWPDTLLTDNPCYTSQEFKRLILDMSVKLYEQKWKVHKRWMLEKCWTGEIKLGENAVYNQMKTVYTSQIIPPSQNLKKWIPEQ